MQLFSMAIDADLFGIFFAVTHLFSVIGPDDTRRGVLAFAEGLFGVTEQAESRTGVFQDALPTVGNGIALMANAAVKFLVGRVSQTLGDLLVAKIATENQWMAYGPLALFILLVFVTVDAGVNARMQTGAIDMGIDKHRLVRAVALSAGGVVFGHAHQGIMLSGIDLGKACRSCLEALMTTQAFALVARDENLLSLEGRIGPLIPIRSGLRPFLDPNPALSRRRSRRRSGHGIDPKLATAMVRSRQHGEGLGTGLGVQLDVSCPRTVAGLALHRTVHVLGVGDKIGLMAFAAYFPSDVQGWDCPSAAEPPLPDRDQIGHR